MDLGFANRTNELDYICGPSPDHQIIIDAPAGYGKSFLLEEVKRRYEHVGWKCVLIRLDEIRGKNTIRNSISEQIGIRRNLGITDQDADAEIRKNLAKCGKVILLIDAEERALEDDRTWLIGNFIPSCVKGLTGLQFRIIVSGRYTTTFSERKSFYIGYRRIYLDPFNQTAVQQLLEKAINLHPPQERQLPESYIQLWAEKILELSGGHPKSIQKLINALIGSEWTLPLTKEEDKRLFKFYIDEEVKILTSDLDELTRNALENLSIFRQFSVSTIKSLQKKNYLPSEISPLDILARLTNLGLVSKTDMLYSDAIVSQFVLARMKVFAPDRYIELNSVARDIYDNWIKLLLESEPTAYSLDPEDLVPFYLKECLFHSSQILSQSNAIDDFARRLKKYGDFLAAAVGTDERDPLKKNMLKNMMLGDADIQSTFLNHGITTETLISLAFSENNQNKGEHSMLPDISGVSNITDSLSRILDFLRQNAQNVLFERWEKRNIGKAITPPSFSDKTLPVSYLQSEVSKKIEEFTYVYQNKFTHVFNRKHLESLLIKAQNAQSTIDKFEIELTKPVSRQEKIQLESERDEYQQKLEQAIVEMADAISLLYSKQVE